MTKEMYDEFTTCDDVEKVATAIDTIIKDSGLSANVLHTMFSFYVANLMDDIRENARKIIAGREEKDVP